MKSQRVMALLLSMALSFSTCVPLGSITAFGAENGVEAQAGAVQEVSDSEENTETSDAAATSSETESASEEKADAVEEVLPEETQEESADEVISEDLQEEDAEEVAAEAASDDPEENIGEADEADSESVNEEASDEAKADDPAQEAESSETEKQAADLEEAPAASEETPSPAAEIPAEDKTDVILPGKTGTVKTDAQNSSVEVGPEDFANAEEIKVGDIKDVNIEEEYGFVLYRFVPEETGAYSFYSSDNSGDPYCDLFNSDGIEITHDDDSQGDSNFRIKQVFTAGETYYFEANSFSGGTAAYTVHLEKADFYCERVGDYSRTVSPNEEFSLEVSATSSSKLSYQWYYQNEPIEGETSAVCTVAKPVAGTYSCYVSDEAGESETIDFNVTVENHLTAYPSGADKYESNMDIRVALNTSVDLKVIVSADDLSGISYSWYDENGLIENDDTDTCTIDSVDRQGCYRCHITDRYNNSADIWFNVFVENHLKAYPEGTGEYETNKTVYAAPNASVDLKAIVSADDMSQITYLWYDSNGDRIEGADSNVYTIDSVTKQETYSLSVSDQYNNYCTVWFDIRIENHLNAYPEGEDEDTSIKNIHLIPGSSADLKVVVSADDTTGLFYQWLKDGEYIEGSDSDSITTGPVSEYTQYRFEVSDPYGNNADVYFNVYGDNGLNIYPEGYVDYGSRSISIQPGEAVDLKVVVSAIDKTDLTLQWYEYDVDTEKGTAIAGAVSDSYKLNSVTRTTCYYCEAVDKYGNEKRAYFYIKIDNNLLVYPEGNDQDNTYKDLYVSEGSSVDLKVIASATDMSQLTYSWYRDYSGDYELIDGADSALCTINSVEYTQSYTCIVTDRYGNKRSAEFHITPLNIAGAQEIKAGESRTVDLTDSDHVIFKFTPTQTSGYKLYSSHNDDIDPYLDIYSNTLEKLYSNDDGGSDFDFSLSRVFNAGTTYYISARCWGNETGSTYTIHLEKDSRKIQNISASDMTLICGSEGTIEVSGAQGELEYNSLNSGVAEVDGSGTVYAYSPGTAKIEIYAEETEDYLPAEITITVTVVDEIIDIKNASVTNIVTKTYNGAAQTQKPVVKIDGKTLTADTDYTVSYKNNKNAGTATMTITGKGKYTGSISKTFKINKAAQSFTVKAAASSIDVGKTTKVTASGAKETTKYTFTSSNTKVAAVNAAGTVTGKAAGTVTITVKTAATTNYNAGTKTVKITVNKVLKKPGNCHFVKWNNSKYTSCRIGWNKVAGADGYQTLLSWTDGTHASTTYTKSNVLYRNCTVHPQHVSQMKVRAFYMLNGQRKFGPWSNVEYITPSPTKLTKINKSSGSNLKMFIKWNIIYGCNGYNVFVTTNPNGKWYWNQSTSIKANATSATITKFRGSKLKKNTRYYVRIVTRRKRNGVFCTVPMPSSSTNIGSFIIK